MRAVLITGAHGGVGTALVLAFHDAGWRVIATDRLACEIGDCYIPADLEGLAHNDDALQDFVSSVDNACGEAHLAALVNNAAVQICAPTEELSAENWAKTFAVNVTAPFRLVQALLPRLRASRGCIINIGSVHAQATKKTFAAYATSKAALHGLTRALAIDLGPEVRAICLAPAAVETAMLRDGFAGNPEALSALADAHPSGRIANPQEIGRAALALTDEPFLFANGSTFWLDGGVLSRLYDPA